MNGSMTVAREGTTNSNLGVQQSKGRLTDAGISHAEVSLMTYPVKVEVDNPTDWPAILLPFVLGAAAFYFAWLNQQQQIRSSLAAHRDSWLRELRSAAVEFVGVAAELNFCLGSTPAFQGSPEQLALLTRLYRSYATIELMLDKKHPENKALMTAVTEVIESCDVVTGNRLNDALLDFNEKCQLVLEDAWQDVRRDLGHKPTLYTKFRRLLEKRYPQLHKKLFGS